MRHNRAMGRKLLVSRAGAGSVMVAVCALLPGCNLAVHFNSDCVGDPSSRGMSSIECPDAATDSTSGATSDSAPDTSDAPAGDGAGDRR
jgi:hypothetical protein